MPESRFSAGELFLAVGVLEAGTDSAQHDFGDLTLTVRNGPRLFAQMLLDVGVELPQPEPSPSETRSGARPFPGDDRPFGIVIRTGADRFIVAGQAAFFDFAADGNIVEIDEVRELVLDEGKLRPSRYLNGDERASIVPQRGIGIAEVTLLRIVHA